MLTYGGQEGGGDFIRDGCPSTGVDRRKEHREEGDRLDTRKKGAMMAQGPGRGRRGWGWKYRSEGHFRDKMREGGKDRNFAKGRLTVIAALVEAAQKGPEIRE